MMTLAIVTVSPFSMNPCSAGPKVIVGRQVPASQQVSVDRIDHSHWDRLLQQYVDEQGILREYPTSSIRNHTAKLFGYNIWDDLLLKTGGKDYSLNQMEHEVLRKMGEPRIHFAIVCASRSCPRLLNEAYTAEKLESQLVINTRHFFADAGNFQHDATRRQLRLSSILKWFGEDFGDNQAAQLRTIAPYLPSREASEAATANSYSVSYLDYDWGLNDQ